MVDKMSLTHQGWEDIANEIYSQYYSAKKFSIILDNHLPENISKDGFKTFDAYITMDLALKQLPYRWNCGASKFHLFFLQVYFDYFDSLIDNKEISLKFLSELREKYTGYQHDIRRGIDKVFLTVSEKFKISNEEINN